MPFKRHLSLWGLACLMCVGCGADSGPAPTDVSASTTDVSDTEASRELMGDASLSTDSDVAPDSEEVQGVRPGPVEEPLCTSTHRPIVAAHGFIASGDTWAPHARRFMANGYCRGDVRAFDWNSVSAFGGTTDVQVTQLAGFIDAVLEETGAVQVDLIGHSAGGGIAYDYLSDAERAAKVAHYAHVGSFPQPGPAGPEGEVPTLNVWSEGDMAIEDKADIPGATNLRQVEADHYGVATNAETFAAIFAHFNAGEAPSVVEVPSKETPMLWGRVVTFGENTPIDGQLTIYGLDAATGDRLGAPVMDAAIPEGGYWGPMMADAEVPYEFEIAEPGNRPVHYYAEPYASDNPLVYLRGFPGEASLVGLLLAGLPFDDVRAMVVVFSSSRALTFGKDSLKVDGVEILSADNAAPENSSIAFFLYDDNEDGESSYAPVALFQSFPFLAGVDMALTVTPGRSFAIDLNGREVVVPAWPSETEGATVVVFE
jgi:pimeloyl-ACP methyl ester carboxylesterase